MRRASQENNDSEEWICLVCQEKNPEGESVCQGCGAYREEPAYDAIADDEE